MIKMKKIILLFLVLGLFSYFVSIVKAQTTPAPTPTSSNVQDLQNKINDLQNKINDLQGQEKTYSSQISVMDSQIKLTTYKIEVTKEQIADLTLNIDTATKKISN